LPCCVASSVH